MTAGRPNATHCLIFVSKIWLEHSHTHSFTNWRWLLLWCNDRMKQLWGVTLGPQSWKYFWLFIESLPTLVLNEDRWILWRLITRKGTEILYNFQYIFMHTLPSNPLELGSFKSNFKIQPLGLAPGWGKF